MRAFTPDPAATVKLAATTTTGRVQFTAATRVSPDASVRLYNDGSTPVFVEFGGSTVTAALASGMPVPPGGAETFNPRGGTHVAGITAAGTADLYATPGTEG